MAKKTKKFILYYLKDGVKKYWQKGNNPFISDTICTFNVKKALKYPEDSVDKVLDFLNENGLYKANNIKFYKEEHQKNDN